MKQFLAPIISNQELMPDTYLMWLEAPEIAQSAKPGQFIMVQCGKDTFLRRPLSVHQIYGNKLAMLFTLRGKGTGWLSRCLPGDNLDIFGPLGNGFKVYPDAKNLLLIAGGIGIAPLRFLAQQASNQGYSIKLLLGGRTAALLYPKALLPSGIEIIYATEDATLGKPGRVTVLVPDYFDWSDQTFACGPLPMYRNLAENFPQLKKKSVQISLEIMMGCGVGVCYGCTIKTRNGLKQVCQDGPVFDLEDILLDDLI